VLADRVMVVPAAVVPALRGLRPPWPGKSTSTAPVQINTAPHPSCLGSGGGGAGGPVDFSARPLGGFSNPALPPLAWAERPFAKMIICHDLENLNLRHPGDMFSPKSSGLRSLAMLTTINQVVGMKGNRVLDRKPGAADLRLRSVMLDDTVQAPGRCADAGGVDWW